MATRDEVINFILKLVGEEDAERLANALEAAGEKGQLSGKQLEEFDAIVSRLAGDLKEVSRTAQDAATFGVLSGQLAETTKHLDEASEKALALKLHLGSVEKPTRDMERAYADAAKEVERLEGLQSKQRDTLAELEGSLKAAGVDTAKLAEEQARLVGDGQELTEALKGQARAMAEQARANRELRERLDDSDEAFRRQAQANRSSREALEAYRARAAAAKKETAQLTREGERSAAVWNKLRGVFAAAIAALSVRNAISGLRSLIDAAAESEQAFTQLEAALASTGNAAGLSVTELAAMQRELRAMSNFNADQITSAQTRLLSYTDVARNEFPRAMRIILDQSQRLGMSVEQSAETVGKALQQPSKAMESLAKQGFTLSQSQRELLKQLEATGRMAEAQAIIMEMLEESYGGAAAAARLGTLTGALKGLGDQLDNIRSKVADKDLLDALRDEINATARGVEEFANSPAFEHLRTEFQTTVKEGLALVSTLRENSDFSFFVEELAGMTRAVGDFLAVTRHLGSEASKLGITFRSLATAIGGPTGMLRRFVQEGLAQAADKVRELREELPATNAELEKQGTIFGRLRQLGQQLVDKYNEVAEAAREKLQKRTADAFKALGISGELAGQKITAEGQRIIDALAHIATQSEVSAGAFAAAFKNALSQANNSAEVAALRDALKSAFDAGKISADQYAEGLKLAAQRTIELKSAAVEAGSALSGMGEAGRAAAQATLNAWIAARGDLAQQAQKIAADIRTNLESAADGSQLDGLRDKLREIDAEIVAYNGKIAEAQEALRKSGETGSAAMQQLQTAARGAGAAAQGVGEAAEEGSRMAGGAMRAVTSILESLHAEFTAVSDEAQEMFVRLQRGSFGVGKSIEAGIEATMRAADETRKAINSQRRSLDDLVAGYDRVAEQGEAAGLAYLEASRMGEEGLRELAAQAREGRTSLDLLNQAELDRLSAAADRAAQRIAQIRVEAAAAHEELNRMSEALQDALDRRAGNEAEILRRQHEQRLRQIQELAERGGDAAREQAEQARRLAEQNFREEMREIEERQRASIEAARKESEARVESAERTQRELARLSNSNSSAAPLGTGRPVEFVLRVRNEQTGGGQLLGELANLPEFGDVVAKKVIEILAQHRSLT